MDYGDDSIIVDAEPRYSGPEVDYSHMDTTMESMITTPPASAETPIPNPAPHRPHHLLGDEHVHLRRAGLKLMDFEVRGTLGE